MCADPTACCTLVYPFSLDEKVQIRISVQFVIAEKLDYAVDPYTTLYFNERVTSEFHQALS